MSDSQTQPFQPTPKAVLPKRRGGLVIGLLVLLLAGVALAAAVWYAGGPSALGQLGGLMSSFGGGPSATPKRPAAAPSTVATADASALPAEAQQRMFAEQVDSREALARLVGGQILEFDTGAVHKGETTATVALTAALKGGGHISGTVDLKRFRDTWYFFSLTGSAPTSEPPASPTGFDPGVVSTIRNQQAQPGTQEMLSGGLLDGGYRVVKVERITMGPRTATIDVAMSGGTEPASQGRFVCISKTDGGTTYWFVARFEKR